MMPRRAVGMERSQAKSGPSGITIMKSRMFTNCTAASTKISRRSRSGDNIEEGPMVDRAPRARHRGPWLAALLVVLACMACSGGEGAAQPQATQAPVVDAPPPPGITIERLAASIAPSGAARRHPITIVRFDLARFAPVLLTARDDGG